MTRQVQHLLMNFWVAEREGETRDASLHGHPELSFAEMTALCVESEGLGYLVRHADEWRLSQKGETMARGLLRRHRLAERLLCDLLELPEQEFEESACRFEHHLSPEATERICTLLGHPTTCPHGRVIPPGDCCRARLRTIDPIVERLTHLNPGDAGRIVFIAPDAGHRLDRLQELGFSPGSPIALKQKQPSFVVQAGNTEVALDAAVAELIYVARHHPRPSETGGGSAKNRSWIGRITSLSNLFVRNGDICHTLVGDGEVMI
jgi:DtxR family Mn-dependent transcriptional regulator